MLRTSWSAQGIDYSWASLDSFHAVQTSSARIQDVDAIWRLFLPGIEPGIPRSPAVRITAGPRMKSYQALDQITSTWKESRLAQE